MRKLAAICLFILFALTSSAFYITAQDQPPVTEPTSTLAAPPLQPAPANQLYTITVTGTGTAAADADMILVEFALEQLGPRPESTYNNARQTSEDIISALADLGLNPTQQIYSNGNLAAEDIIDEAGRITGEFVYRARFSLLVVLSDVALIDEVIAVGLNNGAHSVENVIFTKKDIASLEDQARTNALVRAREKAEQIAVSLNATLTNPIDVTEVDVKVIQPEGLQDVAASGVLITVPNTPRQVTVIAEFRITFGFQPLTNRE